MKPVAPFNEDPADLARLVARFLPHYGPQNVQVQRWDEKARFEDYVLAARSVSLGAPCATLSRIRSMQPKLTQLEFVTDLNLVSMEIENAAIVFHTYEELNRLALEDEAVRAALDSDALFWRAYKASLLSYLFMTMSRIFDPAKDAITIQKVVSATLGNLDLFSKQALGARKMGHGPKPWWFDDFMKKVWVPATSRDLRHLQKALIPHLNLFTSVYQPIRNAIYAHRLVSDDQAGYELFQKTNREDLGRMLDFLQDLISCIRDLYNNGNQPKLGQLNLSEQAKDIRGGTEKVLRRLVLHASSLTSPTPAA